jgi:hypothetical protein
VPFQKTQRRRYLVVARGESGCTLQPAIRRKNRHIGTACACPTHSRPSTVPTPECGSIFSNGTSLDPGTRRRNKLKVPKGHSITSSAATSRVCGTVRPSAFAVLRLMTKSNLVGCSTRNFLGLVPRRKSYRPSRQSAERDQGRLVHMTSALRPNSRGTAICREGPADDIAGFIMAFGALWRGRQLMRLKPPAIGHSSAARPARLAIDCIAAAFPDAALAID